MTNNFIRKDWCKPINSVVKTAAIVSTVTLSMIAAGAYFLRNSDFYVTHPVVEHRKKKRYHHLCDGGWYRKT